MNITDDPRLTAYALGELKGHERDEIERLITRSPAAKAEVEAIRQMAGSLTYELAGELPRAETPAVAKVARSEHGRDGRGSGANVSQPSSWQADSPLDVSRTSRLRRGLTMAAAATTAAGIAVAAAIAARYDFAAFAKRQDSPSGQAVAQAPSAAPGSADVQQQLAALVEQFNALMDAKRFDEADALVKQAEQLVPNEPITRQLKWMAAFRRDLDNSDAPRSVPADGFVKALEAVEESSVPVDDRAPGTNPKSSANIQGAAGSGPTPASYNARPASATPYYPKTADAYSPSAGPAPQYPTTAPQPLAGAPTPAIGYATTPAGMSAGGAVPASGAGAPSPTGVPAGAVPASAQTAAPCCAPCAASAVPHTICKPVYQGSSSVTSLISRQYGSPAQSTPASAAGRIAIGGYGELESVDQWSVPFDDRSPRVFPKNWSELRSRGAGNESYSPIVENDFLSPLKEPLSTFSADVDTASYANVRRFLEQGQLPPADAVRIEEMLNYFSYDYAPPADGKPFAVHVETAACPWNTKHRLARIAIKGHEVPRDKRPPSNLVFLVDVSGSMDEPNKLPLVKASLAMIIESLNENDRVALVTYADGVQCVLDSTPGDKRSQIMAAITHLAASGATNGEGGIQMAYKTAAKGFRQGGTNRIILCTDGDFNVGVSDDGELVKLIEEKRKSGVFLSIFGFGMGNLKDAKLEKLADHGNGQYGYIDSRQEARKVFVEGLSGTLVTIAKDVKLQVEFNPAQVGAYRLVGYEKRALAAEDFNNDAKDAGDIGAGHNVTALYEIVPPSEMHAAVDSLKYQGQPAKAAGKAASDELFTLKLRYKQPDGEISQKIEIPCKDRPDASAHPSHDFDWAASVATFGMLLRDSKHKGIATFDLALELAQGGKGNDTHGYRSECIELMRKAKGLKVAQKPVEAVALPMGYESRPGYPPAVPEVVPLSPFAPGSTRSGSTP